MSIIQTRSLSKKYKDVNAVECLDLAIQEGELFALLGVNGAGKTTTIKMLTGLAEPTTGDAWIMDKSIKTSMHQVKQFIAVSPQETAVAPNLTVEENIRLIAGIYGRKTPANDLISALGLDSVRNKRAGKLSGGYQRRLSIAMALVSEPKILFLDEPTLGLDVIARSELWDLIRTLKGKITIILTTHYMEEAEALSDRVGIMKDGKLLFVGTSDEVKQRGNSDRFEEAFVRIIKEGRVC